MNCPDAIHPTTAPHLQHFAQLEFSFNHLTDSAAKCFPHKWRCCDIHPMCHFVYAPASPCFHQIITIPFTFFLHQFHVSDTSTKQNRLQAQAQLRWCFHCLFHCLFILSLLSVNGIVHTIYHHRSFPQTLFTVHINSFNKLLQQSSTVSDKYHYSSLVRFPSSIMMQNILKQPFPHHDVTFSIPCSVCSFT